MVKIKTTFTILLLWLYLIQFSAGFIHAADNTAHKLYVGWSSQSITPDKPVALAGQFNTRISREILDPVTCTALAIETRNGNNSVETAILVSCDLSGTGDELISEVKNILKSKLTGFDVDKLVMNATHTHTGPVLSEGRYDIPEDAIQPKEYLKFAAEQIATAATEAWNNRKPAGMSWGLGQAVVGHNRRAVYFDPVPSSFGTGTAIMYGKTNREDFANIEGYEDHGVEMLFFWNEQNKLTGIVINIACPSQETEHLTQLSADFWHEARVELHKRYGDEVYILPQCAAAGDISPHLLWRVETEGEMLKKKGISRRQEIGLRIANAVDQVFPYVQKDIKNEVVFNHFYDDFDLPVRMVTKEEADQAEANAIQQPDRVSWHRRIIERYNNQDKNPYHRVRVNVIRLGDIAIATNPFELFLDYGLRMKNQSDAVMTLVVQLSNGTGGYVPTARAEAGGGYSAVVQSSRVGSEGGQVLVEKTLKLIKTAW